MTTYREIRGQLIKKVSEDPTNPVEGQIWYNTTTGILKGLPALEAWSSTSSMINQRAYQGSAGSLSAALVFGGSGAPAYPSPLTLTEEYDGSVFSAGGAMNVALAGLNGSGTQTAALAFGGFKPPSNTTADNTEEYDGSSWTAGGALGTGRFFLASAKSAVQTAGLAFGGNPGYKTNTEEYNGTSWTAGGALNQGRNQFDGAGTQTAGLAVGGQKTGVVKVTDVEEYDGSTWTSVTGIPTATEDNAASGLQTAGLTYGGSAPSATTNSFRYDGSTWASTPSLATARQNFGGTGTESSSALATGGGPPTAGREVAEEFNRSVDVILDGAWASANNSNTLSEGPASFGTKAGLVAVGGYGPSGPSNAHSDAVEEYDGTNWTTATAYPTTVYAGQGGGTLTAGIISGGNQSGSTYLTNSTTYNGTSWTAAPTLNLARDGTASSLGTQTAALHCGGYDSSSPLAGQTETEEFNGSSWSESGDLSTGRTRGGTAGTQTAALYFGGETTNTGSFPGRVPTATEEYNGTSWTAGGTVPGNFTRLNGSGTQNNAYRIGGSSPSVVATTDFYNGTSWASSDNLISAQNWANSGGSGFGDSIIGRGRGSSTYTNVTQEYTRPSGTEKNVKTITTS